MRKLKLIEHISLDGVIQVSGGPGEDGDFPYGDWTAPLSAHRPESLEWGPFEGLGPDIVEGIRRIKSQDGPDLILSGSSTLTSTLLEHGLADEVLLVVYPVLLRTGKRFFAEGTPLL
jgi:RibD C-terminal domain